MLPQNTILDIIISLVLIYALLSILVSVLLEWFNHYKKARAIFLKQAITHLLSDSLNVNFGELFYNHYLIEGLKNKSIGAKPQYISSRLFAEVLIEVIANQKLHDHPVRKIGQSVEGGKQYEIDNTTVEPDVVKRFGQQLEALNPSPLSDTLTALWQKSEGNYEKLKELLSFWYDDYMDRVSGWYKTKQRSKLLVLGFTVAVALNVDSLHLVKMLSLDDALRSKLVSTAEQVAESYQQLPDSSRNNPSSLIKTFPKDTLSTDTTCAKCPRHLGQVIAEKIPALKKQHWKDSVNQAYMEKIDSVLGIAAALNIPIGWNVHEAPLSWFTKTDSAQSEVRRHGILAYMEKRNQPNARSVILYLFGIAISGVSLSFGAPFWFETLVKVVNIRRAGKKPDPVNDKPKD
jgi:hypothetical protein